MNKFFVGQRVRIKWIRSDWWKELAGSEGRIVAIGQFPPGDGYPLPGDCRVNIDGFAHSLGQFLFDQLEPIKPEGAAPSEFTTLRDLLNSLEVVHA